MADQRVGRRIAIIGTTGSGKTTLAKQVAARLAVPHIEMDALFWGPHWTEVPKELFRQRVAEAVSAEGWTADGNYSAVRDIVWQRAETVVWLDYAFPIVAYRLLSRSIGRMTGREKIWHDNQESFRRLFLSSDSILVWLFRTYWRNKRLYPEQLKLPAHQHLTVIHLRSPAEADRWLKGLG